MTTAGDGAPRHETIFTMEATPIKFGPGASADTGWELKRLGAKRVMVVSDPGVIAAGITDKVRERIEAEGIETVLFDDVHVEPTSDSLQAAADFAVEGDFDGFVGIGGGSSMDTAKVADLVATHPAPIMDYVNPPIGGGRKPSSPLKPLVVVPTTSGTGSEATSVAVLDIPDQHVKIGHLAPLPPPASGHRRPGADEIAAQGSDRLDRARRRLPRRRVVHLAALRHARRPESPDDRPPYQGSNPIADLWSAKALELGGRYLRRAVEDPDDLEARGFMMLGASMAGVGFGSAGVHIPHACAYPIASIKHEYKPAGYPDDQPFVAARLLGDRHRAGGVPLHLRGDAREHHKVAELLTGAPVADRRPDTLPDVLVALMQDVGAPRGVAELGYGEDDVAAIVDGAMKQQRLLVVAPTEVGPNELAGIVRDSMDNW